MSGPSGQTSVSTPFGRALRHWRHVRGVSQLDLASTAATTTRHLSFLETGRSRPSSQMVQRLSDALDLPLRERNQLLEMAGLPPSFPEGDLASDDLAPFRRVIQQLLRTHDPYPALVVDRHWNLVMVNEGARLLVPEMTPASPAPTTTGPTTTAPTTTAPTTNTVQLFTDVWRPMVENWEDVAGAVLQRLGQDLMRFPDDAVLRELHDHVSRTVVGQAPATGPPGRVVCPRLRIDGQIIRTLTVVAQFQSPVDVTLDELRVELIYPEDDEADRFFRQRARSAT